MRWTIFYNPSRCNSFCIIGNKFRWFCKNCSNRLLIALSRGIVTSRVPHSLSAILILTLFEKIKNGKEIYIEKT